MDQGKTRIILGPPGTGKTTSLLNVVEERLAAGTDPRRVAFVSFTRKAAEEGRTRAMERFSLTGDDLPYFRTLHSMAYRMLGMRRSQVFGERAARDFARKLSLEYKGKVGSEDGVPYGMGLADRMFHMEGMSRNTLVPLKKVWEDRSDDDIDWWELERFDRALKWYKESMGLYDYTDMLEQFVATKSSPQIDLLVVDEAQDLSTLQWEMVEVLARGAKEVYVGGDDDQSLFSWSGANVGRFISLPGESTVLSKSYRIPKNVYKFAEQLSSRIHARRQKPWTWNGDRGTEGSVGWYYSPEEVDMGSGTWLLLARNGYLLEELEELCMRQGFSFDSVGRSPLRSPTLRAIRAWEELRRGESQDVPEILNFAKYMSKARFSDGLFDELKERDPEEAFGLRELLAMGLRTDAIWHEALDKISQEERDYFIAARMRGEPLLKKPRIKISTIHAAKGGEADHVMLLTDVSYRCWKHMGEDPDDETRVFYVGATRCRETLNVVMPRTNLSFEV